MICLEFGDIGLLFGGKKLALQPGDGPQSFYFKILAGISSATLETIYIYYDKRGTTYASITE